ncbi:MAG: tetratricopeptide repeat protein [Holosporales bacterium]
MVTQRMVLCIQLLATPLFLTTHLMASENPTPSKRPLTKVSFDTSFVSESQQRELITAANGGNVEAQERLFALYFRGALSKDYARKVTLGTWKHGSRFHKWLEGNVQSADLILFLHRDFFSSHARSLAVIQQRAEAGEGVDQYLLGRFYERGIFGANHMPVHRKTAFKLFKAASKQGVVPATYRLARSYYNGHGTNKKVEKALTLYRGLVEQNHIKAIFSLGRTLEKQELDTPEQKRALDQEVLNLYQKASRAGLALAKINLGSMYEKGRCADIPNMEESKKRALQLYEEAAATGSRFACYLVADLYMRGAPGINPDPPQYLRYAIEGGCKDLIRRHFYKNPTAVLASEERELSLVRERLAAVAYTIGQRALFHQPGKQPRDGMKAPRLPNKNIYSYFESLESLIQEATRIVTLVETSAIMVNIVKERDIELPSARSHPTPYVCVHRLKDSARIHKRLLTFGVENVAKAHDVYTFLQGYSHVWDASSQALLVLQQSAKNNLQQTMSEILRHHAEHDLSNEAYDISALQHLGSQVDYWQNMLDDLEFIEHLRDHMIRGVLSHVGVRNMRVKDSHPWIEDL